MRRIGVCLAVVLMACQIAVAQDYVPLNIWRPFLAIGYESASTGDLATVYHAILQNYRDQGVPVPTQTDFGVTLRLSTGVEYCPLSQVWVGLSAGFSYSPAYSEYHDNSGTVKVNGSVTSDEIDIIGRYKFLDIGGTEFDFTLKPGMCYMSGLVTNDLMFGGTPQDNRHERFAVFAWAPELQASIGTSILVGRMTTSLEVGYRVVSTGQVFGSPYYAGLLTMAQTGFTVDVSVGMNL